MSGFFDRAFVRALPCGAFHLLVHDDRFEHTDPSAETGLVTGITRPSACECECRKRREVLRQPRTRDCLEHDLDDLFLFFCRWSFCRALWTEAADQALGNRDRQCGTDDLWVDAEVHKARDCACRIVCMKRGEDEMSRERGVDPHHHRLALADFTDHDDV